MQSKSTGEKTHKLIIFVASSALALVACGSTPVVKATTASSFSMYVSGMSDAQIRKQFEDYERNQPDTTVSEVVSVPGNSACRISIKGYTVDLVAEADAAPGASLGVTLACSVVQNQGLPGLP